MRRRSGAPSRPSTRSAWRWSLPLLWLAPGCTYVFAPLDDVRVFDGGSGADVAPDGGGADASNDTPDTAAIADTTGGDVDGSIDGGSCAVLFTRSTAQTALGPDFAESLLADVDGDGRLDLVGVARGSNQAQVLRGLGDGSFATLVGAPVAVNPLGLAVGDLNKDGKLDVVAVSAPTPTGAGAVGVLLGTGTPTLAMRTDYAAGEGSVAIAVADLNKDGKLDVVTSNNVAGTISVLLGKGDGTLGAKVDETLGGSPGQIALADLDGDGAEDALVGDVADGLVLVLRGKGDGTFLPATTTSIGVGPSTFALADLDGDGRLDLVVARSPGPGAGELTVHLGKGDGTFLPALTVATGIAPASLAFGDFDGDGKRDVAVACAGDGTIVVHRGAGAGALGSATVVLPASSAVPVGLHAADVDGDGRADLVARDDLANKTITLRNGCK